VFQQVCLQIHVASFVLEIFVRLQTFLRYRIGSASPKSKTRGVGGQAAHAAVPEIQLLEDRIQCSGAHAAIQSYALVPADSPQIELGVFGLVNRRQTRLRVSLDSSHTATFSLSGGTAMALQSSSGIDLEISSGAALSVTVSHGGAIIFSNINISGKLGSFAARSGEIAGTLTATGSIGSVVIGSIAGTANFAGGVTHLSAGNLTGTLLAAGNVATLKLSAISGSVNVTGNISVFTARGVSGTVYSGGALVKSNVGILTGQVIAGSSIQSLIASSLTDATILAGANLGSDGLLGGTGAAADAFAAGTLGKLSVSGLISSSFIGAGVDPADGVFGNGNDTSAGASVIKSIVARGADSTTRFESGAFGLVKLPKRIDPVVDPRFIVV
jgi:hypothetical protein